MALNADKATGSMVRDLGKRRIQYPDRLFCARLRPPLVSEYIELIFGASIIRRQIEGAE